MARKNQNDLTRVRSLAERKKILFKEEERRRAAPPPLRRVQASVSKGRERESSEFRSFEGALVIKRWHDWRDSDLLPLLSSAKRSITLYSRPRLRSVRKSTRDYAGGALGPALGFLSRFARRKRSAREKPSPPRAELADNNSRSSRRH